MSTEAEWRQRPKRVLKLRGYYNLHELSNKNNPHHIVVCDRRFSSCREEVEKQKNIHWIHWKWSKYQPCSHKHSYLLNQLHYTPTIRFIRAHLTSSGHLLKYKHMNVASRLDVLCVFLQTFALTSFFFSYKTLKNCCLYVFSNQAVSYSLTPVTQHRFPNACRLFSRWRSKINLRELWKCSLTCWVVVSTLLLLLFFIF